MFHQTFVAHPRAVGESYFQHQRVALSFAVTLLAAGVAALVHGLVPVLFETTASRAIERLHAQVVRRKKVVLF